MVVLGRVAAAYGVRGWIKVKPFTESPDALLDYATWWLTAKGRQTSHPVVEARVHGATVVAKVEGVETREQAMALAGAEVSVPRDALPEAGDDEVYLSDLADCDVVDRSGRHLGRVAEVQGNPAHPILRVAGGAVGGVGKAGRGEDLLIPFVPAYVLSVDLEANRIEVDWDVDE